MNIVVVAAADVMLRLPFVAQCEEEQCLKFTVFKEGTNIDVLRATRYFCWMGEGVGTRHGSSHCPRERQAADEWTEEPRATRSTPRRAAATLKRAWDGDEPGSNKARRVGDPRALVKKGIATIKGRQQSIMEAFAAASVKPKNKAEAKLKPKKLRSPKPKASPAKFKKLNIGEPVMVSYGKTVYPARIQDFNSKTREYLVRYDGLDSSRDEWKASSDLQTMEDCSRRPRSRPVRY